MAANEIILAGFGGQGILFAGKLLAYCAMEDEKEITWLPSYGPEMRGGTCNCHVIISDDAISSPLITKPSILMVMNKPSLDKFEKSVRRGGYIFLDSSLVDRDIERSDVKALKVPATQMAYDMNAPKLANMVITGAMVKTTSLFSWETLKRAVSKVVPQSRSELLEQNLKALEMGYGYEI